MTAELERWLSLTQENAIDPEIIICDPHHHLWYPAAGGYTLEEFRQDSSGGHQIAQTVFIESRKMMRTAGPPGMQPVGETEYVRKLVMPGQGQVTEEKGIAAGIVGFADLTLGAAVAPVLEAHIAAGGGRFRGVRYTTCWNPSPVIKSSAARGIMATSQFRQGLACLERYNLSFDAWLYHPQLMELADLARAFPGINLVIGHSGGPLGIGPYACRREEVFVEWKKALAVLAEYDNVYLKFGGFGMDIFGFDWSRRAQPPNSEELAECLNPYFSWCVEKFGVDRCMFESNFPVDKKAYSYTVLWNAFKRLARGFSKNEKQSLFRETAAKFYRLN